MTIKYAGPRPSISHHGVDFKEGKEDKYIYLMIAVQILKAIDKNYDNHKKYSYDINSAIVSDQEMLEVIHSYEPNIEKDIDNELDSYEEHIMQELDKIDKNKILKKIDKDVWRNNIKIMKDYRMQRAINKIYYMHCINNIKKVIKRENIKEIDTPFNEQYWHTLQTLQGRLEVGRDSKHTELKIIEDKNKKMTAKLTIGT
jgi:hypothetical protein